MHSFDGIENFSGDVAMKAVVKPKPLKKKKLALKKNIANTAISTENYEYIVGELEIKDEAVKNKLIALMKEYCVPTPDYEEIDFDIDEDSGLYAELLWEKKKVMAFAQSNTESYEYAKDSQYTCFLFDENVDLDAFIDSIK